MDCITSIFRSSLVLPFRCEDGAAQLSAYAALALLGDTCSARLSLMTRPVFHRSRYFFGRDSSQRLKFHRRPSSSHWSLS